MVKRTRVNQKEVAEKRIDSGVNPRCELPNNHTEISPVGAIDLVNTPSMKHESSDSSVPRSDLESSNPPSPATCVRPAEILPVGGFESPRVPGVSAVVPINEHATSNPSSPAGGVRERFLAAIQVSSVGCNLDGVTATASARLSFQGTVVVVYPLAVMPDRRYVLFMDEHGSTGITIYNANAKSIDQDCVGRVVQISRMMLSSSNGRKSLSMLKDSTLKIVVGPNPWWSSLLIAPPIAIVDIMRMQEDRIVTLAGILGYVTVEQKTVRNALRDLLIMRIADRTGSIELRSWNSRLEDYSRFRDRPLLFRRVRVTAFAGSKMCELIDGGGTVVEHEFDGSFDLSSYWKE
jgi:hypothetical protein